MKFYSKLFTLIAVAILSISCTSAGGNSLTSNSIFKNQAQRPKYIFYFIGDGMAAPQVTLAHAALKSKEFQLSYAKATGSNRMMDDLYIKTLPITGLATSNAANRYITDSAAAGTALATGSKTDVGMISKSPDGEIIQTMAEKARDKGMKVGIVSSVSLDHATPACFYAHVDSRSDYSAISDQLLESGFDYFGGGALRWDYRASAENTNNAKAYAAYREKAKESGYKYISTKSEFDSLKSGESSRIIATIDLISNRQYSGDGFALPYTIDLPKNSEDNRITLAQFTQKGIEVLDNEKGFFMMVEGGKIDWACHANDAVSIAYEVLAFDDAVAVALDFAAKHPDETLIVVTGDHDCGGLTLGFGGTGYGSAFSLLSKPETSYITFASKVSRRIKKGQSFEQLLEFACEQYGFTDDVKDKEESAITTTKELSDYEIGRLRKGYLDSKNGTGSKTTENQLLYGGYDPFTVACLSVLNNKAGLDFTSFTHTALPVMVFAQGVGQDIFSGFYDNTDIAKKIIEASDL